jgi:hypothetical protein
MSTQTQQEMEMATKPVQQHEWLQNLVGEWRTETEMTMPDGTTVSGTGSESVRSFGGLWSFGVGKGVMPDGATMEYKVGLGWDVSFKEYRGFMIMSVSSHLWSYTGTLSEDGRVMTLDCVGPDMEKDGETANYRDVIELIDENHRVLTSYGEQKDNGEWTPFMKSRYTRV